MVTKRGLKIIVTSLKGKSWPGLPVHGESGRSKGQKLDRKGWQWPIAIDWMWTVFDLIYINMNEIIISILSFTINLQWFINNQWFVITWSRYRLNDYRNRTGNARKYTGISMNGIRIITYTWNLCPFYTSETG